MGSSNIDQSQVDAFTRFNNQWWDLSGPVRALHFMNEVRVPYVVNGLKKTRPKMISNDPKNPLKNFNIIDVGCGGGILSEALAREGCKVIGVDAGQELIEMSKKHASLDKDVEKNLTYICTTIEEYAKSNKGKFDALVISEVIEHIPGKVSFLENCIACLKPGGSIFITTFNRTWMAWFCGIILAEKVFGSIPVGSHEFDLFISPEGIEEISRKYGCEKVDVTGINFNFFTAKWSTTWHRQVSYAMHLIKSEKN